MSRYTNANRFEIVNYQQQIHKLRTVQLIYYVATYTHTHGKLIVKKGNVLQCSYDYYTEKLQFCSIMLMQNCYTAATLKLQAAITLA